jgi:delta8-fatty-acid desaturase
MSLFGCVLWLVLKEESVAAHMLGAVVLGIFWQQFAFVGHDCGHMSARTHARDHIGVVNLGALVTFFNGISVAWWKATHNVHHAMPNTVDCDPDIAHLPVFALHKKMFEGLYNKYHGRVMEFDWAARNIFVPYQHFWYYPIMAFARWNLYIQSVLFLSHSNDGHKGRNMLDLMALLGFFCWMPTLALQLPSWEEFVAFILLSHAVAGLLNVQITLSHFSQPIFDSPDKEGVSKYGGDFFTRNVISSLDVACPTYLDWFHGGLQFQTLHHCYPRIGRQHLRKTESLIASLCKKHSLPYSSKPFWDCNVDIVKTLKSAALDARKWSPLIYESMCAQG